MRTRFFKWMREKSLYFTYFTFPYLIILAYLLILISFLNYSLLFPAFLYFTIFYFVIFYIGLKFDKWSASIKRNIKEIPTGVKRYKSWLRTFSGGLSLFCILMFCIVPLITQNDYYLGSFFIIAMIYTIFAASWDFLAGYTGQTSFGQAAFFGFAAYVTADRLIVQNWHWLPSLLFGALMAVVISLVIGIPALRLKGPYLALGTLSFASILYLLFAMPTILYGSEGLFGVPRLSQNIVVEYYFVFIFMVLSLIIMKIIVNSKLGTIFKSIRDDETGAEASGINTTKYKIYAFMISAFFAGIAGGFYVMRNYSVSAGIFLATYSFYPLVMVAIGGIATISGSALGAFFFVFLTEGLRGIVDIEGVPLIVSQFLNDALVFSVLLILVIRFAGAGALRSAMERLKDVWDLVLGR
jgi:branched-chain amino acid transport system permease protein